MSKADSWENGLLLLLFQNTNFANVGDATGLRGSTTVGSLYFSLHTADPTEGGNQQSSECNYTSYARQPVARTSGGFTVSANSVSPVANVTFPNPTNATNLPQTATYFGIGTSVSGAGTLLYSGALNPTIVISSTGVSPIISSSSTVTED